MLIEPDFNFIENFGKYRYDEIPILYHYCNLQSFLSIIQSKTIRMSDINTMNDYGEMHWAYTRLMEAANEKLEEFGEEFLGAYDEIVSNIQFHILPVVACFSSEGDVLSQWRAYADDGTGIAIGFDGNLMQNLSVNCATVVYDQSEQVQFHRNVLATLFPMWEASNVNSQAKKDFREHAFYLALNMYQMKNPAFAEEKEVRVTRALTVENVNGLPHLIDPGGNSRDKPSKKKQPVQFRTRDGGLIAYVDLPFGGQGSKIIKEVVLGPKTMNNGNEVSMALNANGFSDFSIKHSSATYR